MLHVMLFLLSIFSCVFGIEKVRVWANVHSFTQPIYQNSLLQTDFLHEIFFAYSESSDLPLDNLRAGSLKKFIHGLLIRAQVLFTRRFWVHCFWSFVWFNVIYLFIIACAYLFTRRWSIWCVDKRNKLRDRLQLLQPGVYEVNGCLKQEEPCEEEKEEYKSLQRSLNCHLT